MLESIRKQVSIPLAPTRWLASAGVIGSFLWLLAHDVIHPIVIYLLEIYLTF